MKVFADDKTNVNEKLKSGLGRVENIVGKGITSIFSFSHNFFKSPLFQGRKKSGLCGKELTHFHTIPTFNEPEKEAI